MHFGAGGRTDNRDVPGVIVGTGTCLLAFGHGGSSVARGFEGHAVRAVAPAASKTLWAALDGREIWRRDAGGDAWSRVASLATLGEPGLRAECLADTRANDPDGILVGTSHARLARVEGGTVAFVDGFESAPGRDRWYTPWGGPPDVRSITEDRAAVYVNVHVGGVLRSRDGGATWQPTIDISADVHRVVTGGGNVYAAGARGLSVSSDAGESWRTVTHGLHADYCRSVAVCGPALLVSASDGPGGGRAAVYRSIDGARTFERCRGGLPDWFDGNIDSLCLDALPDGGLAAFSSESGDLFTSADQGATWSRAAERLGTVSCVLVTP